MRIRLVLPLACLGLLVAGVAQAQEQSSSSPALTTKSTRRSDFTLGTSGGFGFGRAKGYPNEIDKINKVAYRENTQLALGTGGAIWFGVAFNDYLTFGLGMGMLGLTGNDREANGGAFLFHIEAFPLFDVDKALRDLSVFSHVGTGPLKITGGEETADGGLLAYIEGGVAYEGLRFWHFGFGPSASLLHMWSESVTMTSAVVGGRLAFYSGP
jgi:hypothetical protein